MSSGVQSGTIDTDNTFNYDLLCIPVIFSTFHCGLPHKQLESVSVHIFPIFCHCPAHSPPPPPPPPPKKRFSKVAEPIFGMKAPSEFEISYSKPANDSDPIKQLESVSVHIFPIFCNCPAHFSPQITFSKVAEPNFRIKTPNKF